MKNKSFIPIIIVLMISLSRFPLSKQTEVNDFTSTITPNAIGYTQLWDLSIGGDILPSPAIADFDRDSKWEKENDR